MTNETTYVIQIKERDGTDVGFLCPGGLPRPYVERGLTFDSLQEAAAVAVAANKMFPNFTHVAMERAVALAIVAGKEIKQ